MSDFKQTREHLQKAKNNREKARKDIVTFKENLKKISEAKHRLQRIGDDDRMEDLMAEENLLRQKISESRDLFEDNQAKNILQQWKHLSDPRTNIKEFNDDFPILFFPVRLETRFKIIEGQHQLWVRIFPDECSIDTFEEELSETEIRSARNYWQTLWAAGKSDDEALNKLIIDQKKAAWKNLTGNFQPGRAFWITENYQPENLFDIPGRTNPSTIFLTIPVEQIPAEKEFLINYWKSYWNAEGDQALLEQAFLELATKINDTHPEKQLTRELLKKFIPFNLDTVKPNVSVNFQKIGEEQIVAATYGTVALNIMLEADQKPPENYQALIDYWIAFWKANSKAGLIEAAFEELVLKVGDEVRANELITDFEPTNLNDFEPRVTVSFIQFKKGEDIQSRQAVWTRAPRVNTFPDRFLLLGYHGVDSEGNPIQILGEEGGSAPKTGILGNCIPDPLIVGPDPSVDTDEVLKAILKEDFEALASEAERIDQLKIFYDHSVDKIKEELSKERFVTDFLELPETEQSNRLEEIFDGFKDEVKAYQYMEYLSQKSETKWLFDFEDSVEKGMGFKVNLTKTQYDNGFERLFVVGVKLGANEGESTTYLENLIKHHHDGTSGFSLLPQGTPTNNTETENSGFSEGEDHEISFDQYFSNNNNEGNGTMGFCKKVDGKWFSELLGIFEDDPFLEKVANYNKTDQCDAQAMNIALWNATLGYYLENMLTPIIDDEQGKVIRDFFTENVSGRGSIPAIRIGDQPYGILAINHLAKQSWITQKAPNNILHNSKYGNSISTIKKLQDLLQKIREDFTPLLSNAAYVGKAEGDAHQVLLQALGLHASSVEFYQRYAKSLSHLYNWLNFQVGANSSATKWTGQILGKTSSKSGIFGKVSGFFAKLLHAIGAISSSLENVKDGDYKERGLDLLKRLGYTPKSDEDIIPILEKFFNNAANLLKGDLIDDQPLSERDPIRPYTTPTTPNADSRNYIYWLIDNAQQDFNKIKTQQGFKDDKIPNALLYQMLRHALQLAYSNTSLQYYFNKDLIDQPQMVAARSEPDFIGIESDKTYINKYAFLESKIAEITGDPDISVVQYISQLVFSEQEDPFLNNLRTLIGALDHLKDLSTAQLERAFVEHLDCCSYRLDAWLLGLVNLQLKMMRSRTTQSDIIENPTIAGEETEKEGKIYLGAYGFVEKLKPENKKLTAADIDASLQPIFNFNKDIEIMIDSTNAGYIHAPSLNQAVTAAVLRNAYISEKDDHGGDRYKINLSSERVRMALRIIEGIQQGQSLGALLGYQLERGLHDRTKEELDIYIYELRKEFPLVSDRTEETQTEDDDEAMEGDKAISKIEARNVIDGLALIEHIQKTQETSYPFGFPLGKGKGKLRPTENDNERDAIDEEVKRILNINDAVADLAIAEGVHQVVQANYDRAAGGLQTYSKGGFPQRPHVVDTPRSGANLTHRIGIHFTAGLPLDNSALPRVKAEPAVEKFLAEHLPPLGQVACNVYHRIPNYEEGADPSPWSGPTTFTMQQLGLSHSDLLYLVDIDSSKSLTALDTLILKKFHNPDAPASKPRPDTNVEIRYTESVPGKVSMFELAPLLKSLRTVILGSRPLKPTDIKLPNEAGYSDDVSCSIDVARVEAAIDEFKTNFVDSDPEKGIDLVDVAATNPIFQLFGQKKFEEIIKNESGEIMEIFQNMDSYIATFVQRMHSLGKFGVQQTGFGFIYDRKASIYSAIYKKVWEQNKRWDDKLVNYETLIAEYNTNAALTNEEKLELLKKAERLITSVPTVPLPTDPIVFKTDLDNTKMLFDTKKQAMEDWLANGNFDSINNLINELRLLQNGMDAFDLLPIKTDEAEKQIIVLAEDMVEQSINLNEELKKTVDKIDKLIADHTNTGDPYKKVTILTSISKLLFGEDFMIIPEFRLEEKHGAELKKCFEDKEQLLKYQKEVLEPSVDFPVDDWLYGVSKVREKMGHWENMVILMEGFKENLEMNLTPLQLPYQAEDTWLGLSYPEELEIQGDHLLYTALLNSFDPASLHCGLLIDEWTELIPFKKETTGISFQFDQPNQEAPQAILLVTPTEFSENKEWKWKDVEGALHETANLMKLRTIEPEHIERTPYAQFLPATLSSVTHYPFITIALNYAVNNGLVLQTNSD